MKEGSVKYEKWRDKHMTELDKAVYVKNIHILDRQSTDFK